MEAGLTDHVWTLREVLLYRVPPRPQPQALYKDGEGKNHETGWGRCVHEEAKQALQP
jgi:hypothetical protein